MSTDIMTGFLKHLLIVAAMACAVLLVLYPYSGDVL